tara:strand:+ start:78 stop:1136 length:1059 start_codon:yes stop_codon:yes gene_type:complete
MTISQSLNLPINHLDYVTPYFDEKLMDSEVWSFPVTNKGIDGIEILEKTYGLWSDVVKQNNLGRVFGTNQSKVTQIKEDIEQNGVDPSTPPVFVDIETGDIITGGHRHDASGMLSIPGWMFQYVRCKNHWARKRFAKALNNERVFHATLNNRDEVTEHIKYGIKHNEITCQKDIEDEIKLIANNSLSVTVQGTLVKEMVSYISSNGITTVKLERFTSHNETTYQEFIDRSSDPYVKDVLNNPNVRNQYINMDNWSSRINSLIAEAAKTPLDSWLNIQASVALPSKVESLSVKREKVHGTYLQNLADNLDEVFTYKIKNGCYAFQHPKCTHAFLAQDHLDEGVQEGQFVKKSS